jgi:hypothetical protein
MYEEMVDAVSEVTGGSSVAEKFDIVLREMHGVILDELRNKRVADERFRALAIAIEDYRNSAEQRDDDARRRLVVNVLPLFAEACHISQLCEEGKHGQAIHVVSEALHRPSDGKMSVSERSEHQSAQAHLVESLVFGVLLDTKADKEAMAGVRSIVAKLDATLSVPQLIVIHSYLIAGARGPYEGIEREAEWWALAGHKVEALGGADAELSDRLVLGLLWSAWTYHVLLSQPEKSNDLYCLIGRISQRSEARDKVVHPLIIAMLGACLEDTELRTLMASNRELFASLRGLVADCMTTLATDEKAAVIMKEIESIERHAQLCECDVSL